MHNRMLRLRAQPSATPSTSRVTRQGQVSAARRPSFTPQTDGHCVHGIYDAGRPQACSSGRAFTSSMPPLSATPLGSRGVGHRHSNHAALAATAAVAGAAAAAAALPVAQHAPPADASLPPRARIAVFVSGGGSNFKAVHAACLDGRINGDIVAVVSDVPSCGGAAYAQSLGIATLTFPAPKKGGFAGLTTQELVTALTLEHRADLVLLAGFLKLVPIEVVRSYKRAMLNIHPALLPSFGGHGYYGERVHKAVIASGARFSGPTVHFVDEEFDTGPILAQRVVPVLPTDTYKQLAGRVLKEEHLVYPEAVAALCSGRVTWREDGIPILWSSH